MISTVSLVDNINSTLLVPYVDALVSHHLGVKRGDPRVANWVSILVGSYSVCEVLFSGLWGMLSDRIGRRPVLLVGIAGSAVAPVLFGLSQSLPAALAARLLDGFFCGNVGVTRTYLGELTDPSNEAHAFGMIALCFSIGAFIGPLLGGMLSDPMSWAPAAFSGTIFEQFPYLLPNLVYACVAVLALLVGVFSLEETRPPRRSGWRGEDSQVVPLSARESRPVPQRSSVCSPVLLRLLLGFSLLTGYSAARLQASILVLSLPRSLDGFATGPKEFGCLQVCAAVSIFLTQMLIYARGIKRFGPHRCFGAGMWLTILVTLPFPAYGLLADPDRFGAWRYLPVALWQGITQIGFTFCFPTIFMLINRECSPETRGSVNGWSNSMGALSRGLFPLAAGGLFTMGCRLEGWHVPGGRYLVFYVVSVAGAASAWLIASQPSARAINGQELQASSTEAAAATPKQPAVDVETLQTGPEVGG